MKTGFVKQLVRHFGRFARKHYIILLSFILPALILEIALAFHQIYPFGKRGILIIDLYHQYAPFISELQDKLRSFSSLLYSWSGGLGTSFLPQLSYYLSSPLNVLSVLFPKDHLTEAVLFLTLLKVGLAGSFFSVYLKGVHQKENPAMVGFSLLYALSSYVLVFSWNIMWMDAIYLFPLVMLGLVRLVRDSRGLLFCIALAISLLSNFYMAFFTCFFTLLYYPVCLFQYNKAVELAVLFKKSVKFAAWSLLAGGLSAILLLPTYFALRATSAADDLMPRTLTHYFDFFDYISRHFTGTVPSIREGMPNLYCGILVLILIPVYFMSKTISLKEKLWHFALLLLLMVSFNMDILNFIWHGFHFPNQIPYRFSFVYIFLVLSMSYPAFTRLNEFTGKQIGALCMAVIGLVVLSQKFDDIKLDPVTMYVSILCVALYAAAFTLDRSMTVPPFARSLFILLVIVAEMITNTALTVDKIDTAEGYLNREGYASGKEPVMIRRQLAEIAARDKSFYRTEILPPKTTNDGFLYNYRGFSIFSSTFQLKPVRMFQNLGYHSNGINSYTYEGSTPILDSLFGIKYLIYRNLTIEDRLYKQVAANDELTVFTNPYALSPGFLAPEDFKNFHTGSSNPMENQNRLMERLAGVKDTLVSINQKQGSFVNLSVSSSSTRYYSYKRPNKESSSTARVQIQVEKDGQVYLHYKVSYGMKGSGFVMVNGKKVDFNPRHSTLINLGFCKAGSTPELQVEFDKAAPESGWFEVYAYTLNQPAFEKAMTTMKEKALAVESFSDTRMKGRVEAAAPGLMVMTIPYDTGWHVKVDGKEVKTQALDDCLLSFEVEKGSHKIELRFVPDKYVPGLVVTLVSVLILLLLLGRRWVWRRMPERYVGGVEQAAGSSSHSM